jgi:DNA mismatch repair protein MutS2
MHDQAFATLEYDGLRAILGRYAQTPMGRARVQKLAPLDNLAEVQRALGAVSECVDLRQRGANWYFSGIVDPTDALARLRIEGAILEPLAILDLARLCEQALAARDTLYAERAACPALWETVQGVPRELREIIKRVSSRILPSGELDDRASPELARIRAALVRLRADLTRALERLMRREAQAIQDQIVTVRNDRFVIPVKADHRSRVQGVAHGFSSSGATVFIEPLETIEANNELQALRETEEREVARILMTLTEELRQALPAIEEAARAVAELDFIGAKAALAKEFRCVEPVIDERGPLELHEARHPLLEESLRATGRAVVPVSFTLDASRPVMIISGANAGGKTVVLKTAGLLALMALSGLHVPARAARFPLYASVLADVGDRQSLAANLSTFTAHVANIRRMIEICRAPALVLLDEVGTGTDPEEGAALGVAIVDHFRRACHAHVIATTHYSGLKMYAASEAGVVNASVEFDEKTLQPTYRLIVGRAGSSSGLEIARRFGFPEEIVRAAAARVSRATREEADYLQRIKREAEEAEELRRALEEERAAVAERYHRLEGEARARERERQAAFEQELKARIEEFERAARELYAKIEDRAARARIEREARRRAAELRREAARAARAASDAASGAKSRPRAFGAGPTWSPDEGTSAAGQRPEPRAIAVGDRVRLRSFNSSGVVDRLIDGEAEVRVGGLRLKERVENLELLEPAPEKPETGRLAHLKRASRGTEYNLRAAYGDARAELNLIGRTTDEAVDEADKFLDEAYLNGFQMVRIIHGHGTGALRRAIADFLRNHPHVARFAPASPSQGGAGATVVELKQ